MNQDKTIVGYDESIAIDAELLPREKNEKERKEKKSYLIAIYIGHTVN